jgi:hypothetical protein
LGGRSVTMALRDGCRGDEMERRTTDSTQGERRSTHARTTAERRTDRAQSRAQSEWERAETGPHAVGLAAAAGEKRAGIMRRLLAFRDPDLTSLIC